MSSFSPPGADAAPPPPPSSADPFYWSTADDDAFLESVIGDVSPVKLRWDVQPERVGRLAEALIRRSKAAYDGVAATLAVEGAAAAPNTWANTMAPLSDDDGQTASLESILTFPGHVSPDKALRDACTAAEMALSAYGVEASSRKDVYLAVLAYSKTEEAAALAGERARYLARTLRDYKRAGLALEGEEADAVKELNKEISSLGIQFQKNLGEENTSFEFSAAQLAGLPAAYLAERRKGKEAAEGGGSAADDAFTVTLKYPCVIPLLERCTVAPTRATIEAAFNSRCKDANGGILEKLVELRHQKAQLMDYPTHAEFITEVRMSGGAAAVSSFLGELATKLTPLLEADLAELNALKARVEGAGAGPIASYDRTFYCKKLEEEKYNVDHEALKAYFPLGAVQAGLLAIYQELLGLTFALDEALTAAAWHEDVMAFAVCDGASGEYVGTFYLDMHPREGKYGHAACFGLQPACEVPAPGGGGGEYVWQSPVAACVCNFPKPTPEAPSLLNHREVETFFHEFGHVMHQLCSKAKLRMFAGTAVERDFVEAPSQMLENWCWCPEALARMSAHHETGAPIPQELVDALLRSRNANAGVFNMRQIVLGTFDQAIHTAAKADTAAELARVQNELMKIDTTPGTNMAASFGHLAGGYDAQYYGYMWSEVFSADMFVSRFEAEGIFNPATGASYRKEILEAGGSRDAAESLRAFLGRDPIQEPFLKSKGLSTA